MSCGQKWGNGKESQRRSGQSPSVQKRIWDGSQVVQDPVKEGKIRFWILHRASVPPIASDSMVPKSLVALASVSFQRGTMEWKSTPTSAFIRSWKGFPIHSHPSFRPLAPLRGPESPSSSP